MEEIVLRVNNGGEEVVKKINLLLADYLPNIYMYNETIKDSKYYLKPVHIVVKSKSDGRKIKYYYYGRYWYRIEKAKSNGKTRINWIYVGKFKPDPNLPDPPENPLEGLVVKVADNEVEIIASKRELLKLVTSVLESSNKLSVICATC